METVLGDVRYGLRMLAKSPLFTAMALLTLALGLGANLTIFSVVYGLLVRPLPYPDSSRLVLAGGLRLSLIGIGCGIVWGVGPHSLPAKLSLRSETRGSARVRAAVGLACDRRSGGWRDTSAASDGGRSHGSSAL